MTVRTKVIGRQPTDHGEYNPNTSYGKEFQCTLFGCMWKSKHDDNNTAPAVWDGGDTITPNYVDWEKVSGDYEAWLMKLDKPAESQEYPFNGMGYVVLKKNVQDVGGTDKNLLTQDMFYKDGPNNTRVPNTNTIFEVRYAFELAEDVTIPSGSELRFVGGKITGAHTLTGQNSRIDADLLAIFGTDVTLAGTWNVSEAYPEWFGAVKDSNIDSREAIQKALGYFNTVVLSGVYTISSTFEGSIGISVPIGKILKGNAGSNIRLLTDTNICKLVATSENIKTIVRLNKGSHIENFAIEGYVNEDWSIDGDLVGVGTNGNISRGIIDGVEVSFCNIGMDLYAYLTTCKNSVCSRCTSGFYVHGVSGVHQNTSFVMERCYACLVTKYGYKFELMIYSSISNCACDKFGIDENGNVSTTANFEAAYCLYSCEGFTMKSCGIEGAVKALSMQGCSVTTIQDCHWKTSYYADMASYIDAWIFIKNVSSSSLSVWANITDTPVSWNSKYIRIEDWRKDFDGIILRGPTFKGINIISTDSGVSNEDVAKCIKVYGPSVTSYTITPSSAEGEYIDSCINGVKYFNDNTIEINAGADNATLLVDGGVYSDAHGATTLIINGKENGNTLLRMYSTGRQNYFSNFKRIVLNNLSITFTANRQIEGMFFENTEVVLNNVVFNVPYSGTPFKAKNATISFESSWISLSNYAGLIYSGETKGSILASTVINNSNVGLVKNTRVDFSNNLKGYISAFVGKNVIFNFVESDLNAIKAKISSLTSDEKALLKGSSGLALDNGKSYWFTGTNWVDATGATV